jgi:hypothetical protein
MIAHLVMFKLRPGVAREDARVAAAAAALQELPGLIPAIKAWQHGFNLTADAEAWDYGLHSVFASETELHGYFEHPAHLPALGLWNEIATLAFTDFRI